MPIYNKKTWKRKLGISKACIAEPTTLSRLPPMRMKLIMALIRGHKSDQVVDCGICANRLECTGEKEKTVEIQAQ